MASKKYRVLRTFHTREGTAREGKENLTFESQARADEFEARGYIEEMSGKKKQGAAPQNKDQGAAPQNKAADQQVEEQQADEPSSQVSGGDVVAGRATQKGSKRRRATS